MLRALLATDPGYDVVGDAFSGDEALRLAAELRPDIVIVDCEMPRMHGFECVRRLRKMLPDAWLVLTSAASETAYRDLAGRSGADGFLAKREFSAETLTRTLDCSPRSGSATG